VLVVVGTVAIVLAVLAPGIRRARDAYAVRQAGTIVMTELRRAQARAIARNVDVIVEFDIVTGSQVSTGIRIYEAGNGTPVRTVLSPEWPANTQILVISPPFPDCVAPTGDPTNQCATYKPLGYAVQEGRIKIKAKDSSSSIDVVVESATGRVRLQQ
jgi:type II secretory pathway pseudopilin PulG